MSPADSRDRSQIYRAEKAMLQMVRDGDINYQRVFQNSVALSPGVPVRGKDPLRQTKTSVIVFTSLVCRAAMEGGLSPEIAYSLGDSYIQACEDCRDSGELNALAHAMYHDFIHKVHQAPRKSRHVRQQLCPGGQSGTGKTHAPVRRPVREGDRRGPGLQYAGLLYPELPGSHRPYACRIPQKGPGGENRETVVTVNAAGLSRAGSYRLCAQAFRGPGSAL